jgi:hypothetical protein
MSDFVQPLGGLAAIAHFTRPARRRILVMGHPHCGSGSTAALMRKCGFDVGHEDMGRDGISSWMFAAHAPSVPYGGASPLSWVPLHTDFDVTVQHLRDPFQATVSIIVENTVEPSLAFRRENILRAFGFDITEFTNELDRAIASYLFWNKLVELRRPTFTFRIEDQAPALVSFLAARFPDRFIRGADIAMPRENGFERRYGAELRPELLAANWAAVAAPLRASLQSFCATYGYEFRL